MQIIRWKNCKFKKDINVDEFGKNYLIFYINMKDIPKNKLRLLKILLKN